MTSHQNHTTARDAWQTEIVPQLPPDLQAKAVELKAYVRQRRFADATDLLRGLLAYATTVGSLRALGAWAVVQDVADLVPSAWWERLQAATDWLQWIATQLLTSPRPTWMTAIVPGRVLVVDATCIGWEGGHGNDLRIHLAWDLLAGQMAQIVMTDRTGAEQLQQFTIQAGDCILADGGYAYRSRFALVQDAQAHTIMRGYAPTFPLEDADGRPFAVRDWLDAQPRQTASIQLWYQHDGQRYPIRVLAYHTPETKRDAAQRRVQARARKRQRPADPLAVYFADWYILFTTLIDWAAWPDGQIWRLYGARWQIELIFKRCKQWLGMDDLRVRTLGSAQPLVWAQLIVWLLQEQPSAAIRRQLERADGPWAAAAVVSHWVVGQLLAETVRQHIRGTWTEARIWACLDRLQRYLTSRVRPDREHAATVVVRWLTGGAPPTAHPHPDAPAERGGGNGKTGGGESAPSSGEGRIASPPQRPMDDTNTIRTDPTRPIMPPKRGFHG